MEKQLADLLDMILIEFPKESKDLFESISLLKESLNDIMNTIENRLAKSVESRDIASMEKYTGIAKDISIFEDYINHIVARSDIRTSKEVFTEPDEVISNIGMPGDNTLQIDKKAEHTLYEDFTYIRPYGFRFRNRTHICKTWREVLLKTCEVLFMLNKKRFVGFAETRNALFSTNPKDLRVPENICGAIFVEANLSSNSIKQLIIELLTEFGFVIEDYVVYFRADNRKNKNR
ncbi:MAG: hypothetical protein GX144_05940 [Clostridiaceae bacterium]|jgi:hypothetical protein|nr:hypothetical protein [Clostridiaceae bacterium]